MASMKDLGCDSNAVISVKSLAAGHAFFGEEDEEVCIA